MQLCILKIQKCYIHHVDLNINPKRLTAEPPAQGWHLPALLLCTKSFLLSLFVALSLRRRRRRSQPSCRSNISRITHLTARAEDGAVVQFDWC